MSVALSACDAIRSSFLSSSRSSASGFGVLALTLLRQTLTPIRVPRSERRLSLEGFSPDTRDEDVLRQVARVFVIADEAVAALIDVTLMPLDQDVESLPMTCEAGLHQLGVGRVRHRHSTAGRGRPLPCASKHVSHR